MIYKNLIFHLYSFDGFEDNDAIRVHLSCLKHFSSVFDNAKFIISVDDPKNADLIKKTEKAIVSCGFRNVGFKVVENDYYREARTFKEEVIDKLDKYEGLTFFAHSKGTTNVLNPKMNKESVLKWVAGMYYLNLNFIDDVENTLINQFKYAFYGSFKVVSDNIENKNKTWYAGTFYWVNTNRLLNNIKQRGIKIPNLHDRGYAEMLPGEIDELASYGMTYLYPFDYDEAGSRVLFLLGESQDKYEKFCEYAKNIGI